MLLYEVTKLIRSKNAGPFVLTFDIMFKDVTWYRQVRDAKVINTDLIQTLYPQDPGGIRIIECDAAASIKVSFPRQESSGSPQDNDVFGGQQYAPLMDLPIDSIAQSPASEDSVHDPAEGNPDSAAFSIDGGRNR